MKKIVWFALSAFLYCAVVQAEVQLPGVLSDHAVLQRDQPIHIWGWATPGTHVFVRFHGQTQSTNVNELGSWSVYLHPENAGGPYTLNISGDGAEKTIGDLLVGDVWFASGQSNMEMPLSGFPPTASLKNATQEIAAANHSNLRLLLVQHKSSDYPLNDNPGTWTTCTPQTAKTFSAVAYFFGRDLAASENVPIGLVDASWGGTPADSWVSLNTLGADPSLLPAIASRAAFADKLADASAQRAANDREDAAARTAGKLVPKHPWQPFETSWSPAGLYNGMIAPFTPLSIKGFLWYQGETNSSLDRAPYYGKLFSALIGDWRSHFAQGNLPFLYVQISSFSSPQEDWGMVREQQRRTLQVAHTAMVVTLDVGTPDNVHPPDKQTVGARLALAARATVYGERRIAYSGPEFRRATAGDDGSMRVWFDRSLGLTYRGKPATGFELAGADHQFVPADARLESDTVVVTSPAVPHPVYVRYGWSGVMENNLFNSAGLPASTFTSEQNPIH